MGIKIPIRYSQKSKFRYRREFFEKNMKLFVLALFALATAEKKVPPRHPLQRLNKLNKFAHGGPKFDRNTGRLERRFELCGFYDETSEHGGPRERRQADDSSICDIDEETGFCRYDKNNPIRGIQQITKGFSKWAQRYVQECKLQPAKQVDRMAKWFGQLTGKLAQNQARAEEEENKEEEGY